MTRFGFDDEQRLFQQAVRDLLAKECTPHVVRALWSTETGRSPELWSALAEMGVVGLTVPEAHGGLGMDERTLVLLLEESGRAALPAPLVESTAVGVPLLLAAGDEARIGRWLPAVAAGDAILSVGLPTSPYVADAEGADLLLIQRDGALHAVERGDATLTSQRSVDGARRLATVDFEPGPATVVAEGEAAERAAVAAFYRFALGYAAQLLGLAQHLLDTTVAYALDRQQFGKPIGSFQAIKHQLADALLGLEFARPLVYRAAASIATGDPDAWRHASMAKASASDAASTVARTALQVHGAIGYTFEHDLQLWLKRVWALAAAAGDASWHRRRIATQLASSS